MNALFWANVVVRWLHVTSAVTAVGALIFMLVVLQPVLSAPEAGARQALAERVLPRYKMLLHSALGLLLLTGAYNFWIAIPKVRTLSHGSLYHAIIGTKILLVFILFGLVSTALSFSPAAANMEKRQRWLTLLTVLALVILFLSAILRRLWDLP